MAGRKPGEARGKTRCGLADVGEVRQYPGLETQGYNDTKSAFADCTSGSGVFGRARGRQRVWTAVWLEHRPST